MDRNENWDISIEVKSSPFALNLKDVWQYRDLLVLLVKRDFVSFYKQTVLGPVWFFIQPIFTTLVFTFIFGRLARLSTDGVPPQLFYLAGITSWNYFTDCITKTSLVFVSNAKIFGKVYFPRLIMPLSIIISNLIRFGIQFLLFIILLIYYNFTGADIHLTKAVFIFPFLVILIASLGLGAGLIISSLTTKYRDLSFLVGFGLQLLMYGTTVIYPLSAAPDRFKSYIALNPLTGIIEAFRYAFLGKGEFTLFSIGYSSVFALVVLLIGIIVFNKTEKNFVDTI